MFAYLNRHTQPSLVGTYSQLLSLKAVAESLATGKPLKDTRRGPRDLDSGWSVCEPRTTGGSPDSLMMLYDVLNCFITMNLYE